MTRDDRIKDILKNIKCNDLNKYNKVFDYNSIIKGMTIFENNKVGDIERDDYKYFSVVKGTQDYNVKIEFTTFNNIKSMSCTCPHYKDGYNCKHIYALILASRFSDIIDKLNMESINTLDHILRTYTKYKLKNRSIEESIESISKQLGKTYTINSYYTLLIQIYWLRDVVFDEILREKEKKEQLKELKKQELQRSYSKKKKHKIRIVKGLFDIGRGIIAGLVGSSTSSAELRELERAIYEKDVNGNPEPYEISSVELDDYDSFDYDDDYIEKG